MTQRNEMNALQSALLPYDPIVLILDVVKRWLAIVLVVLMAGIGSYIHTDVTYTPQYKTTISFVVSDCSSDSSVYSNLSTTTGLASVFSELLSSSILRSTILKEIGEPSFDGTISASVIPETNLLTVTVASSNPRTTFLVAQAIVDHHHTLTYQVVDGVALEVLQSPTVPLSPANPESHGRRMNIAMLIAAVSSFALLICLSYLKNTVRSGFEARKKLNCNYLGEVPHEHKKLTILSKIRRQKSSILITNPLTSFHYTESIRKVRNRVVQHMRGKNVLMITSLLENEGKSTVSVNLALSLSQKYSKVLLIDCDLKKPACHLLLGRKNTAKGLVDVLTKSTPLSDAVIHDTKSNLHMLLEPKGNRNSAELISSEKMQAIIKLASQEYDYVVVDLPPMAATSDSERLMELADASLLVVRQNTAAVPALNKAIAALQSGSAKHLGCILNNAYSSSLAISQTVGHRYGSYGKYGHYGYYGTYRPQK